MLLLPRGEGGSVGLWPMIEPENYVLNEKQKKKTAFFFFFLSIRTKLLTQLVKRFLKFHKTYVFLNRQTVVYHFRFERLPKIFQYYILFFTFAELIIGFPPRTSHRRCALINWVIGFSFQKYSTQKIYTRIRRNFCMRTRVNQNAFRCRANRMRQQIFFFFNSIHTAIRFRYIKQSF